MKLLRSTARSFDAPATAGSAAVVWAVRRDWPTGDHEFLEARSDPAAAERALTAERAYWRRGPMRPTLAIVRISRHDLALHARARRGCKAPDCPVAEPLS